MEDLVGKVGLRIIILLLTNPIRSIQRETLLFCNALLKPKIINENQIEAVDKRNLLCYNI